MDTVFTEAWQAETLTAIQDVTAWVPNPGQHFVIDEQVLGLFPALRVIATPSTGQNHIDVEACRRKGIAVFSLLDEREALDSITASAEFTLLLLLNSLRRLALAVVEVSEARWRRRACSVRGRVLAAQALVSHCRHIPGWVGKVFPTSCIVAPIIETTQRGGGWADVAPDIAILLGLIAVMFVAVAAVAKRMERVEA